MRYTILVNKENPMKESYHNKIEWVKTYNLEKKEVLVEKQSFEAYQKLQKELWKKNIEIGIDSGYRSIEEQEKLLEELREQEGEEYVKKYVALPKYSEHHTGLAIDIEILNKKGDEEENDKEWKMVHSLLSKHGFILRYPEGKEEITGYSYEPWHIRYVGILPAKIIDENHLALEEYLKDYGCILAINKPEGITSYDVVNEISHLYGIKRVGHTGTLDPMATGVLLVAIGKATKVVELLTAEDKEYIAGVKLGILTDTYDMTGKIMDQEEIKKNSSIKQVLKSFQKTYLQEVPIYSAVKVNGKKLYDYARQKQQVELPKKEVTIKEIELLEETKDTFQFRALVTKGCYIRSLIKDIGMSLGTFATMTSLIRTKQGNIGIELTNTLEEIKKNHFHSYRIEDLLDYPTITVEEELEFKIRNGVKIKNEWNIKEKALMKNKKNQLLGIYEKEKDLLKVWKNFI